MCRVSILGASYEKPVQLSVIGKYSYIIVNDILNPLTMSLLKLGITASLNQLENLLFLGLQTCLTRLHGIY